MRKLGLTNLNDPALDECAYKLQCFIGLLECEEIPEVLFERAARVHNTWGPMGELITAASLVPKWLRLILDEEYGQRSAKTGASIFQTTLRDTGNRTSWNLVCKELSPKGIEEILLDILYTVMQSFPEPYTEILWQETTAQLWPVVHLTCLPFLAVIDLTDIRRYITSRSNSDKLEHFAFLAALTRFLHRVIVILRLKSQLHLLHLSRQAIDSLLEDNRTKTDERLLREALHLKQIDEILYVASTTKIGYDWIRGLFLSSPNGGNIKTDGDIHIQVELQLAFWHTFPDLLGQLYSKNMIWFIEDWRKTTIRSSIQVLAMTNAIGAQLVIDARGSAWISQPVTVRVLVAFRAIYDKDFATAMQILEPDFKEVKKTYGTSSIEFVIVGAQLALCYNALGKEFKTASLFGEMASAIWPEQKSSYDVALIRSIPDIYLFIAYLDSLISLGLYERAKPLLFDLTNSRITSNETTLLCILRILKINRRQQGQESTPGNWTLLQKSINLLSSATSEALYQCFEEAVCILSAVDSLDTAQVSRAKDIIDALDAIETNRFRGSDTMKATLEEYQQEIKIYRRNLGLFSLTGPQLHYCKYLRDGFPKASIAFIERIGTASWDRFQRLKGGFPINEVVEPVATVASSKFHDSGIGSSLQTYAVPTASPTKAPSKLSMNTVLGPGLSEILEVPMEIMAGRPYLCEICGKIIELVHPKYQWQQHVFRDLQPYICIQEDCNISTAFRSQIEFEQHLATHALIDAIICPICGHSEQDSYYFKRHFRLAHPREAMPSDVKQMRIPRDLTLQPCPFCADIPGSENFVRHVSRHCEEVALASLSRGAFDDDSHDGKEEAEEEEEEEERIGAAKVAIQDQSEANVNLIPKSSMSPVMYAIQNQRIDVLQQLVSEGAKVTIRDDSGITPLALASQQRNYTILVYLIENGAEVDDGSLHDAAREVWCDAIRVLIKYGHEPDFPSARHGGRSVLSELCFKAVDNSPSFEDLEEAIRCLVANGADFRQRDLNGKTLFHYALDSSDPIKILRSLIKIFRKVLNDDCYLYTDGQYTYSLTKYVDKGLSIGPAVQNQEVISLLKAGRVQDRYWANSIDAVQPKDFYEAPQHIKEEEMRHPIHLRQSSETSHLKKIEDIQASTKRAIGDAKIEAE